ncbi:MAG: FAD-dependent oxidoreductase [Synergistaceae bacterium]|nr:FAD-dependent oxidoreductase [Synergistaceae bacterium]
MFFLFLLVLNGESSAQTRQYDVIVVGGGTGGCAAAIQAGREGMSVALIEASDFVGGQITGAAVSTMDDVGRTRTGVYGEFIGRVRDYYAASGTATNICLWGGDTIAAEPSAARGILTDMLTSAGSVDILLNTRVLDAVMDGGRVVGVRTGNVDGNEGVTYMAHVLIDATEHGDLLPLTGARYRVGSSLSPNIDPETNVQDITYVAVVRKYQGGLPDGLKMPGPPPDYQKHAPKFRNTVAVSGDTWPGSYPFDIPSHNAYRALPDTRNEHLIVGDDPSTWKFITRTCINWANDYPGRPGNEPGLSVLYVEGPEYRKKIEREAMNRTLSFIWYMQSELGMDDWSVDDGQGYGGYFSNDWETSDDPLLPPEFAPILRCFPPFPYVREGRRIVGLDTLAERDISRDVTRGRAYRNYQSGLALGEYPVDVHGSHLDRYMERDLGETSDSFPRTWAGSQGVFQIPFGALIPEEVDGLIAAEKNISVSRMVNGAIRLQPVTMHTGQAAGAIAAEAVRSGLQPRHVNVPSVQLALMRSGSWIALDACEDVTSPGRHWNGVQWASLYEALPKISRRQFGVGLPITRDELSRVLCVAAGEAVDTSAGDGGMFMSNGEFSRLFRGISGSDIPFTIDESELGLDLKRGDAVSAALDLFIAHSAGDKNPAWAD